MKQHSLNLSIVGAGIGGLTAGLALFKKGFNVEVFEAAKELKPVGAGIILAPNATKIFQELGLYDQILAAGNKITNIIITDNMLKQVIKNDLKEYESTTGNSAIAISRSDLQKILLTQFSNDKINLNKKVSTYHQTAEKKIALTFADNTCLYTDILIGADGIHSSIRKKMFPNLKLRNAHQWCYRGMCNYQLPTESSKSLFELWGAGTRFGFVQVNNSQVYWYALSNKEIIYPGTKIHAIKNLFKTFHPLVKEILNATEEVNVIEGIIQDIKKSGTWFIDNVCLIGDAAHATTPNLGQGACQAIEDAYVLAMLFSKYDNVQECFSKFYQLRKSKVDFVVKTSWNLGKIAQLNSPFVCKVRNTLLRLLPSKFTARNNKILYDLRYDTNS